jgi:predicted membrane-bound dolichyl-phosphate-mannose-protein mannosyltransferase
VARHDAAGGSVDPQWGQDPPSPYNVEHPPRAKHVLGLWLVHLGDNPTGWRIASGIVGALGHVVAYALGRNRFGSPLAGLASGAFLSV